MKQTNKTDGKTSQTDKYEDVEYFGVSAIDTTLVPMYNSKTVARESIWLFKTEQGARNCARILEESHEWEDIKFHLVRKVLPNEEN